MKQLLLTLFSLFIVVPAWANVTYPKKGFNYFENIYLDRADWHIEPGTNIGYVDKVVIRADAIGDNICKGAWDKSGLSSYGRFKKCEIHREIAGFKEMRVYTSINSLRKAEMLAFFSQTGSIGQISSVSIGVYFMIVVHTDNYASDASVIPDYDVKIPPVEVEPPLSCSASSVSVNHGQVLSNNITGDRANGDITIFCNGNANIRLKIDGYSNTNGIAMNNDRTLLTRLTLAGRDPGVGVNAFIRKNSNTFIKVESTLSGVGDVTPGEYSKAIVVNITVL